MSVQLPLPAGWAIGTLTSHRDPRERLDALERDKLAVRAEIREMLERLADRHGLAARDVEAAVQDYLDDMLGDATYELEHMLLGEIEERGQGGS
ncbi:hypothetical protein [Reyranella sp.]|jgi:hypothetical protein|uniref:hypothetical protein n=1 Tax=Reyranella sp. TaxID=1929291 RepID=UPI002F9524B4